MNPIFPDPPDVTRKLLELAAETWFDGGRPYPHSWATSNNPGFLAAAESAFLHVALERGCVLT
jgi:hypothetical protein